MRLRDKVAPENPFNRLGSRTVVCDLNYNPWAMESFKMAMSIIEACTFIITHEDNLDNIDEDMTNSIICAVDLIDELAEGLKPNIVALANRSADLS